MPSAVWAEGHITDVSVGYEVLASTWVESGATAMVEGVEYTGPVRVTTAWKLFEGVALSRRCGRQGEGTGKNHQHRRTIHEQESRTGEAF